MFFSDLKEKLHVWTQQKRETIFVIDGPSQVGKTYFLRKFLNYYNGNYLYIDVKLHLDMLEKLLDSSYKSAEDFYAALCFEFNSQPIVSLKLLVFDGIEYCPKLRQFFKTLVTHSRVNILATTCGGRGAQHYKNLLVPSEEDVNYMMPLNFYEFLKAINQKTLADHFKESIMHRTPISEYLSLKLYSSFKLYNLIGGYPLTISQYNEKNDIASCVETNSFIFQKQFEHAIGLMNKDDANLALELRDGFAKFVANGKYNYFSDITAYKMKQLLSFLEEEYVVNISTALDIKNSSNQSNAKKVFFAHQCFLNAIGGFDKTTYFDDIELSNEVVLTDFYYNQKLYNKPLNFALDRSSRYSMSDALIVNNMNVYLVQTKQKRLSVDYNISMSKKSDGSFQPGVLLFNGNVFKYDGVYVLPSYCSCVLNELFDR
ncbi:MAG: ATP-binding protein [Bacilli bacterium]|nr:ATP-binding protein [Bacilli bacterium]